VRYHAIIVVDSILVLCIICTLELLTETVIPERVTKERFLNAHRDGFLGFIRFLSSSSFLASTTKSA